MPKASQRFTFPKKEHLKSKTLIRKLFQKGNSKVIYPFRLVWVKCECTNDAPIRFAVSVPMKIQPKANKRNRLKRQIKEAWRLNKQQTIANLNDCNEKKDNNKVGLAVMCIYVAREKLPYKVMEGKMMACAKFLSYLCQN